MILKMSCLYQILKGNTALSLQRDVIGMEKVKSGTHRRTDDRTSLSAPRQLHFEVGKLSVHQKTGFMVNYEKTSPNDF